MHEDQQDTRRLLKVFGVAVTDFEDAADELVRRFAEMGDEAGPDHVAALREVLHAMSETNERWLAVTERLFVGQKELIGRVTEMLPE